MQQLKTERKKRSHEKTGRLYKSPKEVYPKCTKNNLNEEP